MFFCETCRIARHWPDSMSKSKGPCEICGKNRYCYDVPSKYLPAPRVKGNKDGTALHGMQSAIHI